MSEKMKKQEKYVIVAVAVVAVLGLSMVGYFYQIAYKDILQNIDDSKKIVSEFEKMNANLLNSLRTEVYRNTTFSNQISQIAGTVSKLDQLSKTDKELLQKYSKIYFLNENYVPESLILIPGEFVYDENKEMQIHTKVLPYLSELLKAARNNGLDLKIISAFRSFGEQSTLKGIYTINYGSGANIFSADQGYSEHQLGTTIDFTNTSVGSSFSGFSKTGEYEWLIQNAYKYGFMISYPQENTFYQFEPWHWRFVGKALAERLHEEKQYFYDLDQRTIDAYLIKIFD